MRAIIFPIIGSDSRNAIRNTLTSLIAKVEGRDLTEPGNQLSYSHLVFAGTEEEVMVHMGVADDLPQNLKDDLGALPQASMETLWFGSDVGTQTRQQLTDRVIGDARRRGCTHYWVLNPGSSATGFTLANAIAL